LAEAASFMDEDRRKLGQSAPQLEVAAAGLPKARLLPRAERSTELRQTAAAILAVSAAAQEVEAAAVDAARARQDAAAARYAAASSEAFAAVATEEATWLREAIEVMGEGCKQYLVRA
jgi:hypothetical protein